MSIRWTSSSSQVTSLAFNQDGTCIVVGSRSGIKIYSTESNTVVKNLALGSVSVASMLYCTSLLAFSGTGESASATPRRLSLYNTHSHSLIQNLSFPTSVLNVHLSRHYLVVILELRSIVHHPIESVQMWCTIDTPPNPRGVAALTLSATPAYLALPGNQSKGVIKVYDIQNNEGNILEIEAHESPLSLLSWSNDGMLLASASVKGTVVRIHEMPQGTKVYSLRRGTNPSKITSIAFTQAVDDGPRMVCVASDHGTVHVYALISGIKSASVVAKTVLSAMINKSPTCSGQKIAKIKLHSKKGTWPLVYARQYDEGNTDVVRLDVVTTEGILYRYIVRCDQHPPAIVTLEGQWLVNQR